MRIIVLTGVVNEKSAAKVSIRLAYEFKRMGHKVVVVGDACGSDKIYVSDLENQGLTIRLVGSGFGGRLGKFLEIIPLLRAIRLFKPDIIYANCDFPLYLAGRLSLSAPVVSTFNHLQTTGHNLKEDIKLGYRKVTICEKLFSLVTDGCILLISFLEFATSNGVVAGSYFARDEVKKFGARNVSVAYWGVDRFKEVAGEFLPKPRGKIWVLSVSRLVPYKRFHLLINSFQEVRKLFPSAKLIIVGTFGSSSYKNYLHSLDKDILFLESVSQEELGFLYENCDLYATASSKEGFGLTVVEAGLLGKPALAFRNSALPEIIIHGKTGFLANSEEEFVGYLKRLVRDRKLRLTMGEAARDYAEMFTWQKCAGKYEELFARMLREVQSSKLK